MSDGISDKEFNRSVADVDICIAKLFQRGLSIHSINGIILGRMIVANRQLGVESGLKEILAAIADGEVDGVAEYNKMMLQ